MDEVSVRARARMMMPHLQMSPLPGERLVQFVGDRVLFRLQTAGHASPPAGTKAFLRTNLGRAELYHQEIIATHSGRKPMPENFWRDLTMTWNGTEWTLELTMTEVGFFRAKAFAVDANGHQHWPNGPDFGVSVHPDSARTANTIYCAFVRMFGDSKKERTTIDAKRDEQLKQLDKQGYTVIPPSGKLRDVTQQLPHIFGTLGCRILHLLPVNPTPTTYARFGRYGSPYACEDLSAIDPALVVFDQRTTGIDQFCELTYAAHQLGGRVFLDMVINHTGWGSTLQENHPDWFLRDASGKFISPGAWGTVWEDLVELEPHHVELWEELAQAFIIWCRRGVDGFRCDAGYKVPVPVWQYIVARVRVEFPNTIFLLEGLGGAWSATEALLTEGGMQWAYSELFQEFSGPQVAGYLKHALKQSVRVGTLVNYSETHDNNRLAERGTTWSRLRNQLSALTSVSGGYGFTCGAEWLAAEKVNVHSSRGMSWDNPENLVAELSHINRLLAEHPCFFDHARLTRLSADDAHVYALRRDSAEGVDSVLVLLNLDELNPGKVTLDADQLTPEAIAAGNIESPFVADLLGKPLPKIEIGDGQKITFTLASGAAHCLATTKTPKGLSGQAYRQLRAQAAWAVQALAHKLSPEHFGEFSWRGLAELALRNPAKFLGAIAGLDITKCPSDLLGEIERAQLAEDYSQVIEWNVADERRITLVPPEHWLLIQHAQPFRVTLQFSADTAPQSVESVEFAGNYIAYFKPQSARGEATLSLHDFAPLSTLIEAQLRFLTAEAVDDWSQLRTAKDEVALLTNGRGGMARVRVDLGTVQSKYDCLLGANLNARLPVDRHVFAKRIRVWVNANGFLVPLNASNLVEFIPGPPARWQFLARAGDGQVIPLELRMEMIPGRNTVVIQAQRPTWSPYTSRIAPAHTFVTLTARIDLEDRNFHSETKRNDGADHHFSSKVQALTDAVGFSFKPAADRQLRVTASYGKYHSQPEWCEHLPHFIEASRGQTGSGDAYSPGWFEVDLSEDKPVHLTVTTETDEAIVPVISLQPQPTPGWASNAFAQQLHAAIQAFVVRRDEGRTVIAGYPWFLDWGRDSLICARGMIAAGLLEEVRQLILIFARFEENGTLPNTIHGDDVSNRNTTDAPLWLGVVCEDYVAATSDEAFYNVTVDAKQRTVREVLRSIALGYLQGTSNGIRVDADSALVWSPSHFTWMDTNYPAGTPREGYPVEIQALWVRLLRQLDRIGAEVGTQSWKDLSAKAEQSLQELFWLEKEGYFSDCLLAKPGQSAKQAVRDTALRSNSLFLIALGLVSGERARQTVLAAQRHLVVPGALRSLAPLPVDPPLPIHSASGHLLNDPLKPYRGQYVGDEDTSRKPAYHNGTAWTWTFPTFCEALALAWNHSPEASHAARAYLGGMDRLMAEGCVGHIPEIIDGDAPHTQRGCDAQAWGVTEALRVWKALQPSSASKI